MPAINEQTREAWQDIANKLGKDRPSPGKRVQIVGGRKHKGKIGTVVIHQLDRFENPFRYGNEASHHMTEMAGRSGYVCLVENDANGEKFWVKARYTKVLENE